MGTAKRKHWHDNGGIIEAHDNVKRETFGLILLREMEGNEGSTLYFKAKKSAVIKSCARGRGTATS